MEKNEILPVSAITKEIVDLFYEIYGLYHFNMRFFVQDRLTGDESFVNSNYLTVNHPAKSIKGCYVWYGLTQESKESRARITFKSECDLTVEYIFRKIELKIIK